MARRHRAVSDSRGTRDRSSTCPNLIGTVSSLFCVDVDDNFSLYCRQMFVDELN